MTHAEAIEWLGRMATCLVPDLTPAQCLELAQLLREGEHAVERVRLLEAACAICRATPTVRP